MWEKIKFVSPRGHVISSIFPPTLNWKFFLYFYYIIALYFISTCKQRVNSVNRRTGNWLSFPYLFLIDQMVYLISQVPSFGQYTKQPMANAKKDKLNFYQRKCKLYHKDKIFPYSTELPPWRNGLACWTSNSKVVGSSPTGGGWFFSSAHLSFCSVNDPNGGFYWCILVIFWQHYNRHFEENLRKIFELMLI